MLEHDRAAVQACEDAILASEGPRHVAGIYYANSFDAERQRRWRAEQMVREAPNRATGGATPSDAERRPRVAAWLTPRERSQVQAATVECLELVPLETLAEVGAELALGRADGALVSTARVNGEHLGRLAALVRDYPGTTVVGLISGEETDPVHAALVLGQSGVAAAANVRERDGWAMLRNAFAGQAGDPFACRAVAEVIQTIEGASSGSGPTCTAACRRFFAVTFEPHTTTAHQITAELGVAYSTLLSRFDRARLPSPKQYLGLARLVHAAHLGESPSLTTSAIAFRLDASSPQSFNRTVRHMMGVSAGEFRRRYTGAEMLERFVTTLVVPYRERLRSFDPILGNRRGLPEGQGGAGTGAAAVHASGSHRKGMDGRAA